MFVDFEVGSTGFEDEGSVFIDHADQTGTAGSTIEPEHDRVIRGGFLRLEEDVVESSFVVGIEREIACMR